MKSLRTAGCVAATLILYGMIAPDTPPAPQPSPVQAETPPAVPAEPGRGDQVPPELPAVLVADQVQQPAEAARPAAAKGYWQVQRRGLFGRRVRRVWVSRSSGVAAPGRVLRSRATCGPWGCR